MFFFLLTLFGVDWTWRDIRHRFHCVEASNYSIFSIMWLFQYVQPEKAVKRHTVAATTTCMAHSIGEQKKLHILNNVPINEIELNRMDLTRKKTQLPTTRNPSLVRIRFFLRSLAFAPFVVLYFKICNFYDAGAILDAVYSTLQSQSGSLAIFLCFTYSNLCTDVNILRPLFHYNSFAFWVIGCAVCTHLFVNSFCVSRACVFAIRRVNLDSKINEFCFSSSLVSFSNCWWFYWFCFWLAEHWCWIYDLNMKHKSTGCDRHLARFTCIQSISLGSAMNEAKTQCRTRLGCELETGFYCLNSRHVSHAKTFVCSLTTHVFQPRAKHILKMQKKTQRRISQTPKGRT